MYDDLLRLELSGKRADIIGFADDVAFTLIGRDPQEISNHATRNLERIERWMDAVGLKLAHQKTGYMIFCTHHNPQGMGFSGATSSRKASSTVRQTARCVNMTWKMSTT
ncbi:uncharacterized protein LOC126565683 [Anopheles maculipalpis]|uniref:uncharacterized protein LOC126559504 n=1 Tax=Anopheles maculipalpis TaxID=1496333 RepID=UPI002158F2AA|nr:uncharacterized protein LOC126559504 [Anopheles maculipalpis]XP_050071630.1 uncharacterized protein LOC126559505 [Anopheles maculipalpis]XP_050078839.1 uncharacterized protein LOC126565683 [Anopheles maculipalpis]